MGPLGENLKLFNLDQDTRRSNMRRLRPVTQEQSPPHWSASIRRMTGRLLTWLAG